MITPDIATLLNSNPANLVTESFADEQRKDPDLLEIINFIQKEELPHEEKRARKIAVQASLFTMEDDMLCYVDPKQKHQKRVAVPRHLQEQILKESHAGGMGGHFSGSIYTALVRSWWWDGMHADTLRFVRNCPTCSIVSGGGKVTRPPLHPIPVQQPFQIVGVDIIDLPKTIDGNSLLYSQFPTKSR